ncbi:helix-turn-helix domain-containing protein [Curtobacterium sp. Leaf183]|uniref:helix-turn-helix domain-containing protein n=1 Tax=Curtobacterium sp. Leaf183 TaxID=1736291 RepID=UPI0009EA47A6|nr:GAF domain-containing protein [Curtobacterium sp. Leaf183]
MRVDDASTALGWLDLLLEQPDLPQVEAHRDALLATGADPAQVDAEARAAAELAVLARDRGRRVAELAALNDIAGRLAAVPHPDDLLVEVVRQARRLLGVDLTYVALLDEQEITIHVADGARSPSLVGTRLPRWVGLVGQVVESGAPRWTSDYGSDATLVHEERADATVDEESVRGLLGVPLTVRGRVVGVLLAAKREERRFARQEIGLLGDLAAHAAVAIDNARAADEVRRAKDTLEVTLRLDADLTAAVLAGGDTATLVGRVQALTAVQIRWVEQPADGAVGAALARVVATGTTSAVDLAPGVLQPVTAAGQVLGALVVDGPVPADVALLLERAAPLIALTLVGARAEARAVQLGRDIATIDLLSRAEPDPAADRQRWRGAGLDPQQPHVVVVAAGDPDVARRFVTGLRLGGRWASAVHRDRLVLVVPRDSRIEAVWDGHTGPVAGIAAVGTDTAGIRSAHVEATRTADALTALGRDAGLARAADLGVFAVLLSRTGRDELEDQTRRELGVVFDEEAVRGVPLVETLTVFLDQGQRPSATAAALRVHVNTVYQRLGSLDRLLGDGWRGRALELQVLLRLWRAARELDARRRG